MIVAGASSRKALRRQLRQARRALSQQAQRQAAQGLRQQLGTHPWFRRARHIGLYLPNDGEIDPRPLLRLAQRRKRSVYLPVLNAWPRTRMVFQRLERNERLRRNRFGILEPRPRLARQRPLWSLDLALMPLVGFDDQGGRLGMGGGFYDRSLAYLQRRTTWRSPRLIGLAHELQRVDRLPTAPWDVALTAVVTDRRWYRTIPAARISETVRRPALPDHGVPIGSGCNPW